MTKDRLLKGLYRGEIHTLQEIITMLEHDSIIIIPEGATNGDMIKAMFPNEVGYGESTSCIYYGTMRFDRDWWDSTYRKE